MDIPVLHGYWNFDETSGVRVDATGNGTDLSPVGAITYGPGYQGNAVQFQETFEYLQNEAMPYDGFQFGDKDFEVTFWWKFQWEGGIGWSNTIFSVFDMWSYEPSPYQYNYLSCYGTSNYSTGKVLELFIECNNGYLYYEPLQPDWLDPDIWYKITYKKIGSAFHLYIDDIEMVDDGSGEIIITEYWPGGFGPKPMDHMYVGNNEGNFNGNTLQNLVDNLGIWITEDIDADYSYETDLVANARLYTTANYYDQKGVCVAPVEGCQPEALMTKNAYPVASIDQDNSPSAEYIRDPYPTADMVCKIKASR